MNDNRATFGCTFRKIITPTQGELGRGHLQSSVTTANYLTCDYLN